MEAWLNFGRFLSEESLKYLISCGGEKNHYLGYCKKKTSSIDLRKVIQSLVRKNSRSIDLKWKRTCDLCSLAFTLKINSYLIRIKDHQYI